MNVAKSKKILLLARQGSPKLKKRDRKTQKNERKIFVSPGFLCGHFIPLATRLGQSGTSMFWLKAPSSLSIKLKALIVFF